ncbi:hypothetical protein [Haladaptatus halobius]|uniref:hypothetical protein n=1 Tax=Haladaptatus halobius TaxID=2884875 RepID=UPI001D0BC0AD|nr:hypothetical protein [Haladaptatus halobius]
MTDDRRSLSPLTYEAYDALTAVFDQDETFTREQAYTSLSEQDIDQVTADDLLQMLLDRGYLYEVEGELRITGE